jgi:hypothetical protein
MNRRQFLAGLLSSAAVPVASAFPALPPPQLSPQAILDELVKKHFIDYEVIGFDAFGNMITETICDPCGTIKMRLITPEEFDKAGPHGMFVSYPEGQEDEQRSEWRLCPDAGGSSGNQGA